MNLKPSAKLVAAVGAVTAAAVVPVVVQVEGVVPVGYRDPIGIVTYCAGGTGPEAVLGKKYTQQDCERQIERDLIKHDAEMQKCVRVPLNAHQRAAFLSFTYNVGPGKFCNSTAVAKLNRYDYAGACAELKRWTLAGGKELPGLVTRREIEYRLCMKPVVSEDAP